MPGLTVFILQVGNCSVEAWLPRVGRMGLELTLEPGPPDFYFPDLDARFHTEQKYVSDCKMQLWCHWVKWLENDVSKSATIISVGRMVKSNN